MPSLNKEWDRIYRAYVSTPISTTRLMQIVPHNGIHYCQMRLEMMSLYLFIYTYTIYHVGMRQK